MSTPAENGQHTDPPPRPIEPADGPGLDYISINPNGRLAVVRAATFPGGALGVLQDGVAGYVERVRLRDDLDAWVNEEGLLLGLPANPVAAAVCAEITCGAAPPMLCGRVLFLGVDGADAASLATGQQQMIIDAWQAVWYRPARSEQPGRRR